MHKRQIHCSVWSYGGGGDDLVLVAPFFRRMKGNILVMLE